MKAKALLLTAVSAFFLSSHANSQVVDIIHLTYSPSNAGDIANNLDVSNVTPWTNGSTTAAFIGTMPTSDFSSGYAGLTVPFGLFGYRWGFEGGFDTTGSNIYDVHTITFDYDVLGHNGPASLALSVGSWNGTAPLPSTMVNVGGIFDVPTNGTRATGSVTYDFTTNTLLVTRNPGPGIINTSYSTGFSGDLELNAGTHLIDILVTNTVVGNGTFDANVQSTEGANALYRIDNFRITGSVVPEPSSLLSAALGALCLLRRKRSSRN